MFQLCRIQFVQKDRLGDLLGVFPFLILCFWEYNACHQCLKVIIPMFLFCWWEKRPSEISTRSWRLRDGKLGRENGSKLKDIVMPKWKNNGLPYQNNPSTYEKPERLFCYDFLDSFSSCAYYEQKMKTIKQTWRYVNKTATNKLKPIRSRNAAAAVHMFPASCCCPGPQKKVVLVGSERADCPGCVPHSCSLLRWQSDSTCKWLQQPRLQIWDCPQQTIQRTYCLRRW